VVVLHQGESYADFYSGGQLRNFAGKGTLKVELFNVAGFMPIRKIPQ